MKKYCIIFLLFVLCAANGFAGINKLGPRLARLATNPEAATRNSGLYKNGDGELYVRVIVTSRGSLDDIRRLGGVVLSHRGDIAVVSVPSNKLEMISDLPGVVYVEAPWPAKAQLDQSAVQIQAVKTRNQLGLTGRNVIIGIIDSGIDFTHYDFRKPDGSTRIKYVLDLGKSGPTYGGTAYDEQDINNALNGLGDFAEMDASGHGTHVAGIAAGDGSIGAGFGDYAGVAPEADLVIVKATRDDGGSEFFSSDQILALTFIDSVAKVLGEPYVANLSLGGHSGAHDGTSVMERFIDSLTGVGKPGKVVVTVAGNDGEADVHAKAAVAGDDVISINIESYFPQSGDGNDMIVLDGWYDGGYSVGVKLISPAGKSYGPVSPSDVLDRNTDEGTVYIWNGYYANSGSYQPGINPFNGDRELYIQISDDGAAKTPATGEWRIEFSGSGGAVDMWISSATMDAGFVQGNVADGKVAIPGTARNAITTGAFISKKNWYDLDGNHLTFDANGDYEKGDIAGFSSSGPVRKGGYQKPDITAPGQIIASSYSIQAPPSSPYSVFAQTDPRYPNALINEDGEHGLSSGTSMAAPHVTGAVALLLEDSPDLTVVQVKEMLTVSAAVDHFVGSAPNNSWGFGKLDVYSALQITPGDETPSALQLHNPAPNPFVNQTRIAFDVPLLETISTVQIKIYNALGQYVRTLVDEKRGVGAYVIYWDGRNSRGAAVGGGVYLLQMKVGNSKIVKKIVFLGRNK